MTRSSIIGGIVLSLTIAFAGSAAQATCIYTTETTWSCKPTISGEECTLLSFDTWYCFYGDPGGGGSGSGSGGGSIYPGGNPLTPRQKAILAGALDWARKWLKEKPACAAMYNNLNLMRKDGLDILGKTSYIGGYSSKCSGRDAYTGRYWSQVYLCQKFENLSTPRAAVTILHESLHTAGLQESPESGPGYMTNPEIDLFVTERCIK